MTDDVSYKLLEFFDLETEFSPKVWATRLELAKDILADGVENPASHQRFLDVIKEALAGIERLQIGGKTAEGFLAAAAEYLRKTGEKSLMRRAYVVACRSGSRENASLAHQICLTALRLGDLSGFQGWISYVKDETDRCLLLARLATLKGNPAEASRHFEGAAESSEWESVSMQALAVKDQAVIVDFWKRTGTEKLADDVRIRLFLASRLIGPKGIHHRLQALEKFQSEQTIGRSDPINRANLKRACSLLAAKVGSTVGEVCEWTERVVRIAERLEFVEDEMLVLAMGWRLAGNERNEDAAAELRLAYTQVTAKYVGESLIDPIMAMEPGQNEGSSTFSKGQPIGASLIKHAASTAYALFKGDGGREAAALRAWVNLLGTAKRPMRAYYQKSAQFSSAMAEIISGQSNPEHEAFCFQGAGMPSEVARGILARTLSQTQGRLEIQEVPLARGSMGQVHGGRLSSGEEVVVKIRYPRLVEEIRGQAMEAKRIAATLAKVLGARELPKLIDSFTELCIRQADFSQEAVTQRELAAIKVESVFAPSPLTEYCGPDVIVQERVAGENIFAFIDRADARERSRVGLAIVRWFFRALAAGYYYYDFHPGNLMFSGDRVAILDFGAVLPVSRSVGRFADIIGALRSNDFEAFRQVAIDVEMLDPKHEASARHYFQSCRNYYYAPFLRSETFAFTPEFLRRILAQQRNQDRLGGVLQPHGLAIANLRFFWSLYGLLARLGVEADLSEEWIGQDKSAA